jgi:hypothetical protein
LQDLSGLLQIQKGWMTKILLKNLTDMEILYEIEDLVDSREYHDNWVEDFYKFTTEIKNRIRERNKNEK